MSCICLLTTILRGILILFCLIHPRTDPQFTTYFWYSQSPFSIQQFWQLCLSFYGNNSCFNTWYMMRWFKDISRKMSEIGSSSIHSICSTLLLKQDLRFCRFQGINFERILKNISFKCASIIKNLWQIRLKDMLSSSYPRHPISRHEPTDCQITWLLCNNQTRQRTAAWNMDK